MPVYVGNALKLAPYEGWDVNNYGHYPNETEVRKALACAMDQIFDWGTVRPADVIVVADPNGGRAVHMGILAGDAHGHLTWIHATAVTRKVVEQILDDRWTAQVRSAWRFRGLED